MGWQRGALSAAHAVWLLIAAQAIVTALAADVGRTNTGAGTHDEAVSRRNSNNGAFSRDLKQATLPNPASAALPSQTPDPRIPVAGNSRFVAAAETAITRDPVDIRIRAALSPIITPLISAVARRGITANVTAALVGPGTPLREFADNVGTNIVHFFEDNLLGTPRGRAFIEFLNSLPIWVPVLDAVSAAATVIAPIEDTVLGLATDVKARLGGATPEAAAAESTAAVTNQRGLDQGLLPVPIEEILTGNPIPFGRRLQDLALSSFLPSATPLPQLQAVATSSFVEALDNLIANVPVSASLEKALSPVLDPIVQWIISTPALATPLARLLGVNSQLETVLNNIGTPALSLVTGFLKSNPAAAQAVKAFAGAPATQDFINAISSIAVGFAPAEKAVLAAGTAVSSVTQGLQAGASTAVSTGTSVADAAGRRHLLQDSVAAVADSVPAIGLPVLPSNAVTNLLSYLHAHPELRTALINFLSAKSTKQFLATITELSLKIDSAQAAGLAGAALIGEGAITAVVLHNVIGAVDKAFFKPAAPQQAPPPQVTVPVVPSVPTPPPAAVPTVPAAPNVPIVPAATPPAPVSPPPAPAAPAISSPPPPLPAVSPPPPAVSPLTPPAVNSTGFPVITPPPLSNPVAPPVPAPPVEAVPTSTPAVPAVTTPAVPVVATTPPVPAPTPVASVARTGPSPPPSGTTPVLPAPVAATPAATPAPVVTPPATPIPTPTPVPSLTPGAPPTSPGPAAPYTAFGGRRHLLQGGLASAITALFPSQTPNPKLPNPTNNPALAAYNALMAEDPFDQQLSAALDPLLQPLTTLLSRTPALSNMLVRTLGVDSPVVQRITNATLPLIDRFRKDLLVSPVFVDASEIATSSPLLEDFFNTIGNFSSDLAPVLRAYTRVGTYLGAITTGQNASEALNAALSLFSDQAGPSAAPEQALPPVLASARAAPAHPAAHKAHEAHSPRPHRESKKPTPTPTPTGRHLLQSTSSEAPLNIVDFLPQQTPNPALPTVLNNPTLGALQQVVANDPFAQRVVAALSPTLSPIVDYAARTPFFSNILTDLASNDNPVIKQITADITPILNTFSQGILQNPTASSILDKLTSGPGVTAFIDQVQSLADMISPDIQSLLNGASFLGNITSILQAQQQEVAHLISGPTPVPTPVPILPAGRRLQQTQTPELPPLEEFLPTQTPNPDLPTPANNQALAALQQVIQNDPVNSRLEAVLAPALAPVLQYMARTPAFSDAITAVAAVNSTLVQEITQIATPLLNTFSKGILDNPTARLVLQDLTVTPNLERFIQGLQNLTRITSPPIISLLNGASFLGNISSILQQQEQAIAHALPSGPRGGSARGLLQADTGESPNLASLLGTVLENMAAGPAVQAGPTPSIAAAVPSQTPLPDVAAILPSQTPNPSLPNTNNNAALAALDQLTANDPFDQQLAAVLSPALGPLFSAISRTPAISNAIASALGSNSTVVQTITQAVTPLLKTFTVGILGNPFSYEALQNFTASPTAQTLLGGLRNATDLGLPELQRVLGVANFLGNITSLLQEFEGTPSPPQTESVGQATPDMTNDTSTITAYDGGIPAEFQGGRRKLLQSTVTAGEFLQQFFNPYYSAPPPPAPPAPADSFVNPLGGSLLPPGASSLGQLVRQIVAFQAQSPALASLLPFQQPAGAPSPLLSPVSAPVLAPQVPATEVSDASPPAQPSAAESQPPVTQSPVTQPLVTAANGPEVSADAATIPLALPPMPHLGALPPMPQLGAFADALPGAPGAGAGLGQASLLPASLSALATAAVLAEQVRPQVDDLAGLISNETATAISNSPIGGLLRNGPLLPVVATPPPPANLDTLLLNLLTSSSPPAPPPFPVDLPAALGNVGSLVNETVTGLTDNVRSAAQSLGVEPLNLLLDASQAAPTAAPALTGLPAGLSNAGSLVNQTISGVRADLQSVAARLNLTVSQVAGAVSDALREPVATPTPTLRLTPTPAAGLSIASLGSIGGAAASALSALGSTPATQSADPSSTSASPAGLGGVLSSLGLSVPTQTPAPSGLAGIVANIGSAGTSLQRGINDISTIESLLNPAAPPPVQAPSQGQSMAPAPSPVQALGSTPPSGAPTPAPYSSLPPSGAPAPAPGSALPRSVAPAPAPVSASPSLAPHSGQDPGTAAAVALAQAGSNANATVADLLSQINDAVASLNSSTAGAVQSLTGAIARYNAAASALEATGGFVNATESLEDALTAATNHGLHDLQSVLNTTGTTAAIMAQGGMAALSGISAAALQGLQAGGAEGLHETRAFANITEDLMSIDSSTTDAALHDLQSMLSSTGAAVEGIFSGLAAALGNATSAAAQDVRKGALQIEGVLLDTLTQAASALGGVRQDLSIGLAAAAGNASLAAGYGAAAATAAGADIRNGVTAGTLTAAHRVGGILQGAAGNLRSGVSGAVGNATLAAANGAAAVASRIQAAEGGLRNASQDTVSGVGGAVQNLRNGVAFGVSAAAANATLAAANDAAAAASGIQAADDGLRNATLSTVSGVGNAVQGLQHAVTTGASDVSWNASLAAQDITTGVSSAAGNAALAAANGAVAAESGIQAAGAGLRNAMLDTVSGMGTAAHDLSSDISSGVSAAAGNASHAVNGAAAAAVSGLQAAGADLRSATLSAIDGVGSAALALNSGMAALGQRLTQTLQGAIPDAMSGLQTAINRTQEVEAVAGDLQDLLGAQVLGNLPPAVQSVLISAESPSGLDLISLDDSLLRLLSQQQQEDLHVAQAATQTPAQAPAQAPAQTPAQMPPQTFQPLPPGPLPGSRLPQLPKPAEAGVSTVTNGAQTVVADAQGLNDLLNSSELRQERPSLPQGILSRPGSSASPSGLNLTAADSELLQLLSAEGPVPAQVPAQTGTAADQRSAISDPLSADNVLLSLLTADAPAPAQAPTQPSRHARQPLQVADTSAPASDAGLAPALGPVQSAGMLQAHDPALPGLFSFPTIGAAQLPSQRLSMLPRVSVSLPSVASGQAPLQATARAAQLPQSQNAQAPAEGFTLPDPGQIFQVPHLTMPDLALPVLPEVGIPRPAPADPRKQTSLPPGPPESQAPAQPPAQPDLLILKPDFTLPEVELPELPVLPSLPTLEAAGTVHAPSQDGAFSVPELQASNVTLPAEALPQVGLPLLPVPERPLQAPVDSKVPATAPDAPRLAAMASTPAAWTTALAPDALPLAALDPAPAALATLNGPPAQAPATAWAPAPPSDALHRGAPASGPTATVPSQAPDAAFAGVPAPAPATKPVKGPTVSAPALEFGLPGGFPQLPELGLPLLALPHLLPALPSGLGPAASSTAPVPSTADAAPATDFELPALRLPIFGDAASAPSAQQPGREAPSLLPELADRLPALGLPLLALPEWQLTSTQAPAPDLTPATPAASMPPVHHHHLASSQILQPVRAPTPAKEGVTLHARRADAPELAMHGARSDDQSLARRADAPEWATPHSHREDGSHDRLAEAPRSANSGTPKRDAPFSEAPIAMSPQPGFIKDLEALAHELTTLPPLPNLSLPPNPDFALAPLPDLSLPPLSDLPQPPLPDLSLPPIPDLALAPVPELSLPPLPDLALPETQTVRPQAPSVDPGSSRAAAALQNGGAFFPDLFATIRGPPHASAHTQADSMAIHALAPEREIRADRAAHAPSAHHGHEHAAGAPHLAPSQQPSHHHRAVPNLAPAPAHAGHPEHSAAHAPAHAPSQHHDHLAPAHAASHVGHYARAPVSGDPHRTGETKSPAHSNSHAEEHHRASSHAPAHTPELHGHEARAPSSHHDAEHSNHTEHGHHAPNQAPQVAPAAHRVEADRDPGHPPPPPSPDVLRRDVEQLLRDAGREPLPSLPSVPAGPTPTLNSLARTVANDTGLYSATERVMRTAQAAVASGNFTQDYKEAQDSSRNISGVFNQLGLDISGSATVNLEGGSFPGSPMPAPLEDFVKALLGDPVTNLFSQCHSLGNKAVQDVGGLIDLILSNAMSLANSMPDITNPMAALGESLGFDVKTPLSTFISNVANMTVPSTLSQAEQEVTNLFSDICTPSSFNQSVSEPAACVSEQVTLQLVPWTCAWDDWRQEDLGQPPVVTCTPAYLQLSYEPAACNLPYQSAPTWTSQECLLNATIWGESSQVTWGAANDLPTLHSAVYNVVEGLADAVHNVTDALGVPPVLSGPPPLSMPPPLGSMPPAFARPPALSIPPGLSSAESDVMGFWDLFTNFGQTMAPALSSLSNFIPNTFSISLNG